MQAKTMLKGIATFILCGAVLASAAALAAEQEDSAGEVEALKKENAELRARCEALEAQVAIFEASQPRSDVKPPTPGENANSLTTEKAHPAERAVASAGLKLNLNDFLVQMDVFAGRYKKAETSVLREDVLTAMRAKAEDLIKDKTLPDVTARVKDVRSGRDGLTTVSLVEVRMAGLEKLEYLRRGQPLMSVSTMSSSASITLRMSADEARMLRPGQWAQITGTPSYTSQNFTYTPAGSLMVFHFSISKSQPYLGGTVNMKPSECRIASITYAAQ